MHNEVLKKGQIELLSLLKLFKKEYYLVGGTAIALHLGHRYSIDFDLFTKNSIKRKGLKSVLEKNGYIIQNVLFEDSIQLHIIVNNVKVTFFQFPYPVFAKEKFSDYIKMPDLLTLAAMKAFALGGRGKWKDYVDLYFILKKHYTILQISEKAKQLFGDSFNEKLFKQQLCYFSDISFQEQVEYVNSPVSEQEIKAFLTEVSLSPFI